jgi:alpha-tubulin suppressor-like RCC1 family protein
MLWSGIFLSIFLLTSCIGNDEHSKTPIGEPILQVRKGAPATKAIDIVAGGVHACVHLEDYTIKCWGDNTYGTLNIKSARNAQKKYYDVSKAEFSKITAMSLHTCGILRAPPYEGIPVCFGKEEDGLDVPHEKVKEITAGGGFTCVIKQDDTLSCVGRTIQLITDTAGVFKIKAEELVKWGVDPTSGAEHQDYSTKKFKNVKGGVFRVCAQGLDDNVVYCMGQSIRKSSKLGTHPFIDFVAGDGQAIGILDTGHLYVIDGTRYVYKPVPNISNPETLKRKKILTNGFAYLTATGNRYDDGTPIPENTLVVSVGYVKEGAINLIEPETSCKVDRTNAFFYLTDQGKMGCFNCQDPDVKSKNSDLINNAPKEIAE